MKLDNSFFNHDAQSGGFFPLAHVGIDISSFAQKQNILIEGIRGTGKTHVLKMLENYYFDKYNELKILPVYVSLAQISEHTKKNPDIFRLYLYVHIVDKSVEVMTTHKDQLTTTKNALKKFIDEVCLLFGFDNEETIDCILDKIQYTASMLKKQLEFGITNSTIKSIIENTIIESSSAGVNIGTQKTGIAANCKLDEYSKSGIEETISFIGKQLSHENASKFIIEFIQNIQRLLENEYTLLLLDECSEASFESQVEIFRLFKAIRGCNSVLSNKSHCVFFVGSVYPKSETYYPTREKDGFYFQPGQDCTMEYLEWDETDIDSYIGFFKEMIAARARYLLGYSGGFNSFYPQVFDSYNTFVLAALCANGIPRRFWEILKQSYNRTTGKISEESLDIALQQITNEQILTNTFLADKDFLILDNVVSALNGINITTREKNRKNPKNIITQTIYFGIRRGLDSTLSKLIIQGAIHDKTRTRNAKRFARPEPIFSIDISIAYTHKILPQKTFVDTLLHDIPICISGDFHQSPLFKTFDRYFSDQDEIKFEGLKKLEEERESGTLIENQKFREEGEVKFLHYFKLVGVISSHKYGEIHFKHYDVARRDFYSLNPGDKVSFKIKNINGRIFANEISVVQKATPFTGVIVESDGVLSIKDLSSNNILEIFDKNINQYLPGEIVNYFINTSLQNSRAVNLRKNV